MKTGKTTLLTYILLGLAVLSLLATATIIFGASFGLWEPITGFGYYRSYGANIGYFACVLAVLSLIAAAAKRTIGNTLKALITTAISVALVSPMISSKLSPPTNYPPIHDITTNLDNPPAFTFLTDDRPGARNSLTYGGEQVAQQQKKAFPDIQPIAVNSPPAQAFEKAKQVAESMNWEIVHQPEGELRFEATTRTPYFHFADDVVVVVSAGDNGSSRIDIRSVSRIGRGDRGVNANRVRAFIEKFNDA